jgi:hypothetical protein
MKTIKVGKQEYTVAEENEAEVRRLMWAQLKDTGVRPVVRLRLVVRDGEPVEAVRDAG